MQIFNVSGMTCGHCVKAITQALLALDAQANVQVDLACAQVRIDSLLSPEQVQAALREEGYESSPVQG